MRASLTVLTTASALALLCGYANAADDTYTLYRNSAVGGGNTWRIHVATFDAETTDPKYNQENCAIAAGLFQAQPGVIIRYWCEKGRFKN